MSYSGTCYRCGIVGEIAHNGGLLFTGEDRQLCCDKCARELSKLGVINCINSHHHHLGTTCKTCGQVG